MCSYLNSLNQCFYFLLMRFLTLFLVSLCSLLLYLFLYIGSTIFLERWGVLRFVIAAVMTKGFYTQSVLDVCWGRKMEIIPRDLIQILYPEFASRCSSDIAIDNGSLICLENGVVLQDHVIVSDISNNVEDVLRNQGTEVKSVFLNREKLLEAIELYKQGVPISEIMARLGIRSCSALYRILPSRRVNVTTRRRVKKDEIARICEMYRQGLSIYRIAKETGRAFSSVKYIIDRYCREDSS